MIKITIAASYTADYLKGIITYWIDQFVSSSSIDIYNYNSIMDHILTADDKKDELSIILIRVEDLFLEDSHCYIDCVAQNTIEKINQIQKNAEKIVSQLIETSHNNQRRWIFVMCPSSSRKIDSNIIQEIEQNVINQIQENSHITVISSKTILDAYDVNAFFNDYTNEAAHIPYTEDAFLSIGTTISRYIYSMISPLKKVIVCDCDNTLWKGVCAEDGYLGISITPAHQAFQQYLKKKSDEGKLICLASKNLEEDVWSVFDNNPDMILKREDIVCSRINWEQKSQNIKDIAKDLDLSLNSFVFIDDNPIEINEVEIAIPEIITWKIPVEETDLLKQLKYLWPLDVLAVTESDIERKNFYKINAKRDDYKKNFDSLPEFIKSLDVRISVNNVDKEQFERCSQMTYRTNQFNTSQGTYTAADIEKLHKDPNILLKTITLDDKFGNYGIIGFAIAKVEQHTLVIQDFYMSCRALNRLAEYTLLEHLANDGSLLGLTSLHFPITKNERNSPACVFIDTLNLLFHKKIEDNFDISLSAFKNVDWYETFSIKIPGKAEASVPNTSKQKKYFNNILTKTTALTDITQLSHAIYGKKNHHLKNEDALTFILNAMKNSLNKESVNADDNFFDIGGKSIDGVGFMSEICHFFDVNLPLVTLYQAPTPNEILKVILKTKSDNNKNIITSHFINSDKTPLIFIHPAGGSAHPYSSLTNYIEENPLYFIDDPYIYSLEHTFKSLQEMCEAYAVEIQKLSLQNIILAGWSFGGLVALELSKMLPKLNIEVEKVILIDTYNPRNFSKEDAKLREENLLSNPTGFSQNIDRILKNYQSYMDDFKPSDHYKANVYLLKCKEQGFVSRSLFDDPNNGWNDDLIPHLKHYYIKGDHKNIFIEKNISDFVSVFKNIISEQ